MSEDDLKYLSDGINRALGEAVDRSATLYGEARREVSIRLSPLEKYLRKDILVYNAERTWSGVLIDFGDGYIVIEEFGCPVIIYTGPGVYIQTRVC
jgi:hypothetical protein